jgi:hypothetical protein
MGAMVRVQISAVVAGTILCAALAHAEDLPTPSGTQPPNAVQNPLMLQPFDRLVATRERPLFAPTRRPPPVPPEVASHSDPPPPPLDPPSLSLFGIVKDMDGATAIIRPKSSDKVLRVRVGDKVGGWTVAQVEERKLVLLLDDRSTTFMLFSGGQSTDDRPVVAHRTAPIVEVNEAGILTAHRVKKSHR